MSGSVPQVQTDDRVVSQLQNNIVPVLNRLQKSPFAQGAVLKGIVLSIGSNSIPHGLGRNLQGWSLTRQRALASIFDTQDANSIPAQTLQLTSSAACTVDIYVF